MSDVRTEADPQIDAMIRSLSEFVPKEEAHEVCVSTYASAWVLGFTGGNALNALQKVVNRIREWSERQNLHDLFSVEPWAQFPRREEHKRIIREEIHGYVTRFGRVRCPLDDVLAPAIVRPRIAAIRASTEGFLG